MSKQNSKNQKKWPNQNPKILEKKPAAPTTRSYERQVLAERTLNQDLEKLAVEASKSNAQTEKCHAKVTADMEDEILDEDDLKKLSKTELIDKLKAARKVRNSMTTKARAKTRTNVKNIKNLTEKLISGEKREKLLKDKCEYLYDLCIANNIEVDFAKIRSEVEKKDQKRALLHDNLFLNQIFCRLENLIFVQ